MTDTKNATYMDKAKAAGYNPALVRKPKNDEAFQVQIPGLADGVTVPVYEDDLAKRVEQTAEPKHMDTAHALAEARDAIEGDDLAYSTRKAGPWSIFVLYLVPFTNKARRAEVHYDEESGTYRASIFGMTGERTPRLKRVVEQLRAELIDG